VLAWEAFVPERLLDAARACEARLRRGEPLRLLEGIPVGVKDIFNTTDYPTQMGSPLWEGFTPGNDARVVFNLKESGGLVAGKTVTAEFAVHELRKTRNPHDRTRTPGTSSSGSAAAISTGMVPAALGTQTGASIIRPASFCGIYGYKPSFGLLPRTGVLKTTDSLDTLGFFSVYFEDLRRLFEALRAKGRNYPIAEAALGDTRRQAPPQGRPWKVAFVKTHTWAGTPEYARQAIADFARKLDAQPDFTVEETDVPASLSQAHDIHSILYDLPLFYYFKDEFERDPGRISDVVRELIAHGQEISTEQYQWALKEQVTLQTDMERFLTGYDAMISLSTAGGAPLRHERELPDPSLMWTLTHLPVLNAPVFRAADGLPFGLQLVARKYDDYKLLGFARALLERELIPALCNPNPKGM
jgi:Asp-tRNA(Asn)/Glu-tRNA(Gln) amidotransferase A subunit family amidase